MFCQNCRESLAAGARFCSRCGAPAAAATGPGAAPHRTGKSVLWIVIPAVAIAVLFTGGIIAAIAIPNLLNAIDRGKQKRTMADLRSIGTAIEEYAIDHDHYPIVSDLAALEGIVEPVYLRSMPLADGWGIRFQARSSPGTYMLLSTGKDGVADGCAEGTTRNFNADICFQDGQFTQWPEGTQR